MSKRTAAWLAWGLFAVNVILSAAGTALQTDIRLIDLGWIASFLMLAAVGALIASLRPDNPIGWLFCIGSLLMWFGGFARNYALYTLDVNAGVLPGGVAIAWIASWIFVVGFMPMFIFSFLLFPNGRLASPRWRWVAWLSAASIGLMAIATAFKPGQIEGFESVENPLGMEAAAGILELFLVITSPLLGICLLISVLSPFVRFRRARGDERQQLKWFAYAAFLLVATLVYSELLVARKVEGVVFEIFGILLGVLGLFGVPVAVGTAILKYRLYDIDIIINRTLVYGTLTTMLAAIYVGSVVLLRELVGAFTGQADQSPIVIVASTLAIAALFQPLRRRIQAIIDRRFYRRKYDAQKMLAAFSLRMRDEMDLDQLTSELVRAVQETLQPAHVSLWLRQPERKPE